MNGSPQFLDLVQTLTAILGHILAGLLAGITLALLLLWVLGMASWRRR